MNQYYYLWLEGFLKAGDLVFNDFQNEVNAGDLAAAAKSLKLFTRAIHGATETLRNARKDD